jgi:hypothetical protein
LWPNNNPLQARKPCGYNGKMEHTHSFVVVDENRRQYTVHEMTDKDGIKRHELRDSPGKIRLIDEKTFQLEFPFAKPVTAILA